ncbi:glycosyltransferase family 1 protein [Maribellus luteus]|uniref:Glycosyltransferase family 1 protein n=1 Tax=Maribellus luteus TaxID=2305463 RepID=A0A399SX71_9BACT|nr:glycosyltransferase family 1 protein [Maribellus luteus]RIJ46751.1 glycosyltransferase family 1 protein [Maribellus luteus]
MQVVIAHSHLNPGRVSRIIASQTEVLRGTPVKILTGACPDPERFTSKGAELMIIGELNYLEKKKYAASEAKQLLDLVYQKIREHITPDTVLHFHNLNLGKNPVVTYAVYQLAKEGVKVFSHVHDFAEDRPSYLTFLKEILTDIFLQDVNEVLYPKLPNYQFGVLNSADLERLVSYGADPERIVWLPKPVNVKTSPENLDKAEAKSTVCQTLKRDESKLLVTYPVKVIQRKNIGELILLSILFDHIASFVVTQAPQNPVEIEMYQQWVKFCSDHEIDVIFEAGMKTDFETLLTGSDFCITTSYRESFGMVYLEPWLLDTPIVGRDIDYITRDFKEDGFEFPALYYKLNIPGIKVDFKDLNMKMQMEIISDLKSGRLSKQQVFEQNPILNTLFKKVADSVTEKNKTIIQNNYSLKAYGNKLQEQYRKLIG